MYDKSIQDLLKACDNKNNDADTFHSLGMSYLENQEYQNALEKITKAIELDDTKTTFYINKALTLYHLGEHILSLEFSNKAL